MGAAGAFGSGSVQELNEDHRVGSHNGSTPGRLLLSLPSVSDDNVAGSEGGSIEVKSESSKKVSSTLRLLFTFPILLEGPAHYWRCCLAHQGASSQICFKCTLYDSMIICAKDVRKSTECTQSAARAPLSPPTASSGRKFGNVRLAFCSANSSEVAIKGANRCSETHPCPMMIGGQ